MKNLLSLSALAAVLVASATYASAQIYVGSGITATTYNGYFDPAGCNGATGGAACNNTVNPNIDATAGTVGTANVITSFGSWSAPTGTTSWITGTGTIPGTSTTFGTAPGYTSPSGGDIVPDGYYTFTSAGVTAGESGNLSVMADDTVAVFYDVAGTLTLVPGLDAAGDEGPGQDGHCSLLTPNCNSLDTVSYTAASNGNFVFVVEQTGGSAMGLDYEFSAVPEPSSLLMFGTGLVGSAGMLFRRMRRS